MPWKWSAGTCWTTSTTSARSGTCPKPEKKPDEASGERTKRSREGPRRPTSPRSIGGRTCPTEDARLKFDGYDSPEELVRWQLYEKYSGGLLAELGSQLFDAAAMFVAATPNRDPQRPYPLSVAGSGSQILRDAAGDIDDHVHCVFEYAIQATWTTRRSAQGPQEDRPAVRPDHRQRVRRLRRDGAGPAGFAGAGERAEGDALPYLGRRQDLRVVEKKATKKKAAKAAPAIEVPKDGKADEESAGPRPAGPARGRCGLRRRVGALGLLLQAAGRQQGRQTSHAATPRPACTPRCYGRRRQGREEGDAGRFQEGMVRRQERRNARRLAD